MNAIRSTSPSRPGIFRRLRPVFLVATATFLLPSVGVRAAPVGSAEAKAPAVASAPPAHVDDVHVPEGCYISTMAYLAKFRAAFPDETGAPLTVELKSFGGPHTIAVVTWQGRMWGRDEYCGVFDLRCASSRIGDVGELRERAAGILDRRAASLLGRGRISAGTDSPADLADSKRWDAVRSAARLLPVPSQTYRVRCSQGEIPLLFFQPAAGTIAVYDPAFGTATAECELRSARAVVAMVAKRLGYGDVSVMPDAQLVAAATTR